MGHHWGKSGHHGNKWGHHGGGGWGRGRGSGHHGGGWGHHGRKKHHGCGGCDVPCCDFGLLSTSMLLVSYLGRTDRAVTGAIKGYRKVLSPRMPVRCRFEPSCSTYGLEAVQRYGSRRGLRLAAARLRRCKPAVVPGTHDPVP